MQNALRFFARNARIFTAAVVVLSFILFIAVPYGTVTFGLMIAPLLIVGMAGSFVMFLEDYARIQAQRNA